MKRFSSLLLAIVMLLGLTAGIGLSAYAETDSDGNLICDGYTYVLLDDGTVEITGYVGEETDLSIPTELDGLAVTSIGESAFWQCESLTSVEIPDCVTNLGDNAFFSCENLESVAIGKGVSVISFRAFYGCSALKDLTISEGVSRIDTSAFSYCTGLIDIVLPDSINYIDSFAFAFCSDLESIKIPEGLTYLSSSAFENCSSLKSLVIPVGIKEMEFYQFSGCEKLESIYIMNKDMVFGESRWPLENATIYGYKGSTAQAYAEKNGIKFVAIDKDVDDPEADNNEAGTPMKPNGDSADKNDPSKSPNTGSAKELYAFAAVVLAGGAAAFIKKKEQ